MPSILIADDNALSLQFLAEAARGNGWRVATAVDGADTLRRAAIDRYDVILLDLRMPDLDGMEVLARLRACVACASRHTAAIATSADGSGGIADACRRGGFVEFIEKPLSLSMLRAALARHWPRELPAKRVEGVAEAKARYGPGLPLLDDAAAIAAIGDMAIVTALRQLFARELDALPEELDGSPSDEPVLRERLHRLRASCGFCGASALEAACRRWSEATSRDERERRLRSLRILIAATRAALPDPA